MTNEMVATLKSLDHVPYREKGMFSASKGDWGEVERLRGEARDFLDRVGMPEMGSERADFRRLTQVAPAGSSAASCPGGYGERGSLYSCRKVEHVALPKRAAIYDVANVPELTCLLGPADALFAARPPDSKVGCYADPRLKGHSALYFDLALEMLRSGMVRPVRKVGEDGLAIFTVLKKFVEGPDGALQPRLRPVLDCRRVNARAPVPPKCALGSLESVGRISLPAGGAVCGYAGDVPDYFYTLRLPDDYPPHLWLKDLPWQAFVRYAIDRGVEAGRFEGSDALGFTCPPMGWSWAPLVAQKCLENILDTEAEGRLGHRDPAVDVDFGAPALGAHWEYLDDYGRLFADETPERAEARAASARERDRGRMNRAGLAVHKEQFGAALDVLGARLDGDRRRVVPAVDKFRPLVGAVRYVVREASAGRRFRPIEIERLLGRMTWMTLLRREIFAAFGDVYTWIRRRRKRGTEGDAGAVPGRVLIELRTWLGLCPLLKANLSAPWHPEFVLSDAGPEGFGVVTGLLEPGDAEKIQRGQVGMLVKAVDKLAVRGGWNVGMPQVEREGKAAVIALSRLARDRGCRDRKVLQALDAQSVIGALNKGRSSSAGLFVVAMRAAARALFAGWQMRRVWVPSHLNLADGPSRGALRPSVHLDCARGAAGQPAIVDLVGPRGVWRPASGLRRLGR